MRPARAATIYDVAAAAGVSISTVSLTFNYPNRVSEATRYRVHAAAESRGFRPQRRAGSRGRPRVLVAAPFSSYPSFHLRLDGILAQAQASNVEITLENLPSAAVRADPLLESLPSRPGIDGLILMGVPPSRQLISTSSTRGLAAVVVDAGEAGVASSQVSTVSSNDIAGGELLGKHLHSLGHRRALFVHEPQRSPLYRSAGQLRYRGLAAFLNTVSCALDSPASLSRISHHLRAQDPPTVIAANHDQLAAAVFAHARQEGINISVTGYDDGPISEALGITTVHQPFELTGQRALSMLLDQIECPSGPVEHVDVPVELIVRSSTGGGR